MKDNGKTLIAALAGIVPMPFREKKLFLEKAVPRKKVGAKLTVLTKLTVLKSDFANQAQKMGRDERKPSPNAKQRRKAAENEKSGAEGGRTPNPWLAKPVLSH